MSDEDHKADTRLTHLGRDPAAFQGALNPPIHRVSTVAYPTIEAFEARRPQKGVMTYGRFGTPGSFALEDAIAALQGGAGAVTVSSGLAAIGCTFLALLDAGDHLLVSDSVYRPTRKFCDGPLKRLGVETSYYDPLIAGGIADLFRPNTRLVYTESPGSLTFEVQDIPAIAKAAKAAGVLVATDTTWATPLCFRPFEAGVDVAIEAATKYVVGHSDAMLGLITANAACEERIRAFTRELGICAGSEEVFLGLRGLRTLGVRLARHQETAFTLANWLAARTEVERVLYPPLPSDPGHALWRRDYSGASGLFGFVLARPYSKAAIAAMLNGLELFSIGASWGGYESLIITGNLDAARTATAWRAPGPLLRIHAGLEDAGDLIADLEAGFARLEAAR